MTWVKFFKLPIAPVFGQTHTDSELKTIVVCRLKRYKTGKIVFVQNECM